MKRYSSVAISGSSGENLVDALAGLGERKRRIINLIPSPSTYTGSTVDGYPEDIYFRVYKNQDQIVNFNMNSYAEAVDDGDSLVNRFSGQRKIEVDVMLDTGEGFKVGFYHASANAVGDVVIEYEDL